MVVYLRDCLGNCAKVRIFAELWRVGAGVFLAPDAFVEACGLFVLFVVDEALQFALHGFEAFFFRSLCLLSGFSVFYVVGVGYDEACLVEYGACGEYGCVGAFLRGYCPRSACGLGLFVCPGACVQTGFQACRPFSRFRDGT